MKNEYYSLWFWNRNGDLFRIILLYFWYWTLGLQYYSFGFFFPRIQFSLYWQDWSHNNKSISWWLSSVKIFSTVLEYQYIWRFETLRQQFWFKYHILTFPFMIKAFHLKHFSSVFHSKLPFWNFSFEAFHLKHFIWSISFDHNTRQGQHFLWFRKFTGGRAGIFVNHTGLCPLHCRLCLPSPPQSELLVTPAHVRVGDSVEEEIGGRTLPEHPHHQKLKLIEWESSILKYWILKILYIFNN